MPDTFHVLTLDSDREVTWGELLLRNAAWHATHSRTGETLKVLKPATIRLVAVVEQARQASALLAAVNEALA